MVDPKKQQRNLSFFFSPKKDNGKNNSKNQHANKLKNEVSSIETQPIKKVEKVLPLTLKSTTDIQSSPKTPIDTSIQSKKESEVTEKLSSLVDSKISSCEKVSTETLLSEKENNNTKTSKRKSSCIENMTAELASEEEKSTKINEKDEKENGKDVDELMDTSDDEAEKGETLSSLKKVKSNLKTSDTKKKNRVSGGKESRRRVLEEDSSDEENEGSEVEHDSDGSYKSSGSLDESEVDEESNVSTIKMEEKKLDIKKKVPASNQSSLTTLLTQKSKPKQVKKSKQVTKMVSFNSTHATDEYLLEAPPIPWNNIETQKNEKKKHVPYQALCQTFALIEATPSRLEIQKHLTDLLRLTMLTSSHDLLSMVYLASNSVAAAYECVELGVGDAVLMKAIGEASGTSPAMIKQKYEVEGDLGSVAKNAKGKQRTLGFGIKPKPLAVHEVLNVFRQIATTSGAKSQKWKVDMIKGLLVRAQEGTEAKYIIRGLQGKLRIGLAQSTVLTSLAHAVTLSSPLKGKHNQNNMDKKNLKEGVIECSEDVKKVSNMKIPVEKRLESAVNIVKKAYSQVSSHDALVEALISVPLGDLAESCSLRPGLPVEPMLAKPTKSVQEVLKRLDGKRFTCEYKYDGERAQVHMSPDGVTKVYSRSLLNTSEKYPEVPLYVKLACANKNVKSFILDTEVVAYNRETKQFVPFQILSTRKKIEELGEDAKVKVIVQAFDLMYLNGVSLLDDTLAKRRKLLKDNFDPVDGKFQYATSLDHIEDGDTTMLEEFLDTAIKGQCEGLMVKTLDENASYQPSHRSLNWLKLKKDYLEGMGDSVDLVPLGAYYGRGKRTGVYGAYLLACYDLDTEEFQSVCKIGTGFSDEDLKLLSAGLNEHIIQGKSTQYNVSDSLGCDVWFDACQVWEVKAADLSKSSTHKGAVDKTGETGRGIGLRFPRFERLREDKKPEHATSSDQILEMYFAQESIVEDGTSGNNDGI